MISRRYFMVLGAAASLFPKFAIAQDMQFPPDVVLGNLEKAVWLSTNRSAPRAAYVVAAPWCPYCKQFYDAQAARSHDIDYRFVFMDFRQFGPAVTNAYFSDVEDQVGLFYNDRSARNPALSPRSAELLGQINTVTGHSMANHFRPILAGTSTGSAAPGGFAYPTVVQREQSGSISAILGGWMYLDEIEQSNSGDAKAAPDTARYGDLLRTAPRVDRGSRNYFAKAADTPYFSAPIGNAPQVAIIGEGSGYKAAGTMSFGGEEWVAVLAFTSTDAMQWGRMTDFFTQ